MQETWRVDKTHFKRRKDSADGLFEDKKDIRFDYWDVLRFLLFRKIMLKRGKGSITPEFTILMRERVSLFLWVRLGRPHSTRKDICFEIISQRLLWKIWTQFSWGKLRTRGVRLREYLLIGIIRILLCCDILEEADWDLAWRQSYFTEKTKTLTEYIQKLLYWSQSLHYPAKSLLTSIRFLSFCYDWNLARLALVFNQISYSMSTLTRDRSLAQ